MRLPSLGAKVQGFAPKTPEKMLHSVAVEGGHVDHVLVGTVQYVARIQQARVEDDLFGAVEYLDPDIPQPLLRTILSESSPRR